MLPEPLPTLKGTGVVLLPLMRVACHVAFVAEICVMGACRLGVPVPVTVVDEVGSVSKFWV